MGYPGDTTLSREIQLRILSTFKQALRHAERDEWEEAHFSCDFMLRLDPVFEPARALKRRMTDDRVVEIDDLREISEQAKLEPGSGEHTEASGLLLSDDDPGPDDLSIEPDLLSLDLDAADDSGDDSLDDNDEPRSEFELELDQALSDLEVEGGESLDLLAEPDDDAPPAAGDRSSIDRESEQRIGELLTEGQAAFDRTNYQQAIDAWSRIFLIDIDHVEASRLIDEARVLKAEAERELDEILHEGISHLEVGEDAMARDAFNRVLALAPNHLVAKEYLSQLEGANLGLDSKATEEIVGAPPAPKRPVKPEPPPVEEAQEATRTVDAPEAEELGDVELASPKKRTPRHKKAPKRSFLYIGAAVLVLALAAGWYLFSHWDQVFPNSTQESAAAEGARRVDPIQAARNLHESGKTSMAISQLGRLAPEDPNYAEAQAMIAQFKASAEGEKATPEDDSAAPSAAMLASLKIQVDEAYGDHRYLKSSLLLDRIAEIEPLDGELTALREDLDQRLAPIQKQIDLIQQGEWEYALPQLWRLLDKKPDDRDVLKLLVDGYFNLGVRDLQRGHPTEAAEKFREALSLSPDDADLQRLDTFAKAYQAQPQDLRYRIFIKYVPFR